MAVQSFLSLLAVFFFFGEQGGWPAASTPKPGGPGYFLSTLSSSSP